MAYASSTSVSVEKTEAEIKSLLRKNGAGAIATAEAQDRAMVSFEMKDRRITFRLPLPDRNSQAFLVDGRRNKRPPDKAFAAWEQACRSRWRGLFLCIKAKLESVDSGIETFEEAFLAHITLGNGQTVGEHVAPGLAQIYSSGEVRPLLPPPSKKGD